MARKLAGRLAKGALSGIALAVALALPSSAEDPALYAAPPLSPPCEVPDVDLAAPTALPNIASVLRSRGPVRILAIGSAVASGLSSSSGSPIYPGQLETILERAFGNANIEIIHRGVTGEVAEITADRIMSEVALDRPELVLWQLGLNDALSRVAPNSFEATVRATIRWLKDNDVDVVLVGQNYSPRLARDPNCAAIRMILQRIATEEKVLYIRRYDIMRALARTHANLQLMARDNFHLSDLGYRCMAEHVAHAVIHSVAQPRRR
jgi:lysophospholipase L1-like esterase